MFVFAKEGRHSCLTPAGPRRRWSVLARPGRLLDECALLLSSELHHAPVFIGHASDAKIFPATGNRGDSCASLGSLYQDFQRDLSKLVARHFMRFLRRLFFL
jgi:hypothetical protein